MTTEIGTKNKTIKYINIHKEGLTAEDTIDVDNRWTTPILDKQSDYLVAISRFEVPLNRVPVTAQMDNCIEIFRYNDFLDDIKDDGDGDGDNALQGFGKMIDGHGAKKNVEQLLGHEGITSEQAERYLIACENYPQEDYKFNMTKGNDSNPVNLEPCHTIYEFVSKLNSQIQDVLLLNMGNKKIVPGNFNGQPRTHSADRPNLFQNSHGAVINMTQTIATCKIHMSADYTFSVQMNHAFCENYYIKMSKALFNLLQFKENDEDVFSRLNLLGRRFMGSRHKNITDINTLQSSEPAWERFVRRIQSTFNDNSIIRLQTPKPDVPGASNPLAVQIANHLDTAKHPVVDVGMAEVTSYVCTFSAPVSAADTVNRIKSLVFTSSLPTSSEGSTGGTYRRLLTDYTIPVNTGFSWDTDSLVATSVSENAASEYTYSNPNPSSGRLLIMLDPSPLYELKLQVMAKCWDFEHEQFVLEPIPLPAGSTFTAKLVFISRNEIHQQQRPDHMLPH